MSSSPAHNSTGDPVIPVPDEHTPLYDESGVPYLVPNFLLPRAKFAAAAAINKAEIDPQAACGVSKTFTLTLPHVCRCYGILATAMGIDSGLRLARGFECYMRLHDKRNFLGAG